MAAFPPLIKYNTLDFQSTKPFSADALSLTCLLNTPAVPVTGQPRLVYLLLEISGGEIGESLPMNLGLVMDVSDSMRIHLVSEEQFRRMASAGQVQEIITDGVPAWQMASAPPELIHQLPRRIDYVRDALVNASEYLRAADTFSLVAFAGQASKVIPTIPGSERDRLLQAAREMEYLRLGDGTQMNIGMKMALDELQRSQIPGSEPIPPPPARASRMILLTDGHTLQVEECYATAQQARQLGLTISTMGIGSEFNEDLLIPLADLTGGHAYYIEKPEQIPDAFRQELGAARAVRFRNVEVKLRFPAGVELRRAYRALPEIGILDPGPNMENSYALLMGNYDPTAPPTLLLELLIPPWQAGIYRLAQAVLAWDDPGGGNIHQGSLARSNQRIDIIIHVEAAPTMPINQRVMNILEKVTAYKVGVQALEEAQSGDPQAATQRLRLAATRLLDMGETALGNEMLRQAETLEKYGHMDPNATKKLRYETRRLTKNLEVSSGSEAPSD